MAAHPPPPALYRAGVRAALLVLPLGARLSPALARARAARRELASRMTRWAAARRDPGRPLVWMHASSVGEGLHAKPVLERLRARHPEWQLFFTHFSPSAERFAAMLDVDGQDYLPFDSPGAVRRALAALRPTALVFAHADVWPELTLSAASGGVPVALVSAVVSPDSTRLRAPARLLLRRAYVALAAVAAADAAQRARLVRLGTRPERIEVLGDTRYDSAIARAARAWESEWARRVASGSAPLIAGSTWPPDEAVVFDAFRVVRATHAAARLVMAPHQPSAERLAALHREAAARSLPEPVPLAHLESGAAPAIVLVDRVGVLADLYAAGAAAYVGGGFGRAGLHSVLEPAACSLPVVVGPRRRGSRDAGLLEDAGALVALPAGARAAAALARQWTAWLGDPEARAAAGARALAVVRAGQGAADRTTAMVERLVGTRQL